MKHALIIPLVLVLSSCGAIDRVRDRWSGGDAPEPAAAGAQTAAALDATTQADKAAALSAGGKGGTSLGQVVVSLGSPSEQGFWLRSALVSAPAKGRVVTDQGASIAVDLLPGTGAAQLSLPAFRALGLPLTGLPQVTVYTD